MNDEDGDAGCLPKLISIVLAKHPGVIEEYLSRFDYLLEGDYEEVSCLLVRISQFYAYKIIT